MSQKPPSLTGARAPRGGTGTKQGGGLATPPPLIPTTAPAPSQLITPKSLGGEHARVTSQQVAVEDPPGGRRGTLPRSPCPGNYAGSPGRGASKQLTCLEDGLSAAQLGEGGAPRAPGAVVRPGGAGRPRALLSRGWRWGGWSAGFSVFPWHASHLLLGYFINRSALNLVQVKKKNRELCCYEPQ